MSFRVPLALFKSLKPTGKKPNSQSQKYKMEIPAPSWIELPGDVTANILGRLDAAEILESVQKVCTTWWKVCKDHPTMWRVITLKYDSVGLSRRQLSALVCLAVDRSQGQLIELTLHNFGDDELLSYVVDRSSKLRSLELVDCFEMKVKCLIEAVKTLPHLEELHLVHMACLHPRDIKIIGVSCPLLKSFSFNDPMPGEYYDDGKNIELFGHDGHALAIAKTMPNLRHLQVVGLWMGNDGVLKAILDGCPYLESLDLWNCFGLDLGRALEKRCSEQIKYFRCPLDINAECIRLFDSIWGGTN